MGLIICISAEAVAHLREDSSENLLQESALGPGKVERSNQVVGALSFIYMHLCLTGAVVIVEFEFVVEMNLVQIEPTSSSSNSFVWLQTKGTYSPARTATGNWGDAIKAQRLLNSSWPSRGDPFPPVFVMETAENRASRNLAVMGKGMFVVILQRWEYRGTFRNPGSEAQMGAPLVVMSNPL